MNKEEAIKYLQQLYPNGGHCWLDEQRIEAIGMAIKALQEEHVSEFLNTESMVESYKQRLISQANGVKNSPFISMCMASYKHGINETLDTLNLSNVERTVKDWKEEPVSGLDNGDMPIERWKQAVKAASNQGSYRSSKGLTETRDDYFVDGVQWADEHPKEEPVSEDLKEAARSYSNNLDNIYGSIGQQTRNAFKAGAQWQFDQLEKNRLAACDRQTEEEAEIERDFVMGVIENEHRQPTFDDAIKYGMMLQKEQMMAKAKSGTVQKDNQVILDNGTYIDLDPSMQLKPSFVGLKEGDRIKVIVIKED